MCFLHTTAMDCSSTGVGGLEASLKLKYVLVVPKEQAAILHNELLMHGVPEQQIIELDPNKGSRSHKFMKSGPAAVAAGAGAGDRKRYREKRFMPSAIKLGTYAAGGRQFNVTLRWESLWISTVDRAPAVDGGGVSEVSTAAGSDGTAEKVSRVVDLGEAVAIDDNHLTTKVQIEGDGGGHKGDAKMTVGDDDCENDDDDDPNLGNDDQRCNSSSTLCDDCKRLLNEYFSDRSQEDIKDQTGEHVCIYRRIVDRLFVVTATGASDDDDNDGTGCCKTTTADDDDGTGCCKMTTSDDDVVGSPSTAADHNTSKYADLPEQEQQPFVDPTTPSQPAPPTGTTSTTGVDYVTEICGKPVKSKKITFFGKLCGSKKNAKKISNHRKPTDWLGGVNSSMQDERVPPT